VTLSIHSVGGVMIRMSAQSAVELGDNCIVFENFTASIGDLMVAN